MAGEDDVLIKIAADVAQAVTAIQSVGTTIDTSFGSFNETAAAMAAITQTLTAGFESLGSILGAVSQNVGEMNLGMQTVVGVFEGMAAGAKELEDDSKKAGEGLEEVGKKTEEVGKKQEKAKEQSITWGVVMAKAIDDVTNALGGAIKAFPQMVAGQAEAGEQLNILSNRLNLTADATRELQYVSAISGVNMNVMARATQGLSVQLQDVDSKASKAVTSIGLFPAELSKLSKTEAMAKIVDQIKQLPEGIDKGAKMIEIFGSKAQMMTGLLKEDLGELHNNFTNLVDEKAIQDSARLGNEFGGAMTNIKLVMEETKRSMSNAVLPAVNAVLEVLPNIGGAALIAGESLFKIGETMAPMVGKLALARIEAVGFSGAMSEFGGQLTKLGPALADFGGQLLSIGKFLLTNPWGILITAAAILLPLLWDMVGGWEGISKAIAPVITYFEDMYTIGKELAEMFLGDLVTGLGDVVGWFKDFFTSTDQGMGTLNGLITWAKSWIDWLHQFPIVGQYIDSIRLQLELVAAVAKKLWEWTTKFGGAIADFFKRVGIEAHDTAEGIRSLDAATAAATKKLEEQKAAQATATAGNKEQAKSIDTMAAKVDYLNSAYGSLSATEKKLIQDGLAAGMSTEKVAEELRKTLYHGITTIETAKTVVDRFKDSVAAAKKAADSNPLAKFVKDAKELGSNLALAAKAGAPMADVVAQFGKHAAELLDKSKMIPGAFALLDPAVKQVAQAFKDAEFQKTLDKFYEKTGEIADLWKNALPDAVAAADAAFMDSLRRVTAMQEELTDVSLDGAAKRMAAIDKEETARIADANKRLGAGTAQAQQEIDLIHKIYADKRKVEQKYTGDVMRDIEMRGYKTQEQLDAEVTKERAVLDEMVAARAAGNKKITLDSIRTQEELVAKSEEAAGKVKVDWGGTIDSMVESFTQLAQISGGTFGGIMQGVGKLFATAKLMGGGKGGPSMIGQIFGGKDELGKPLEGMNKINNAMVKGAAAAATVAEGVGSFMKAMDQKGRGQRAMGGAMAGAQIGSVAGPYGMAIGAAAGLVAGLVKGKPAWAKAADEVSRDFGAKISDELGKTIADRAKTDFKGDRFTASIASLPDILKEAGGVTDENAKQMTSRLHDVFSLMQTGKLTADQARATMDSSFGAFAQHILQSGKVASKEFQDIIKLNQESGLKSAEVVQFVVGQTQRFGSALQGMMSPLVKNLGEFTSLEGKAKETAKALAASTDPKEQEQLQKSLVLTNKQLAEAQSKLGDTGAEMGRFERLAVAGFNAALKSGAGYLDAVDQLGPALDTIVGANEALGRESSGAIKELLKFREVATAHQDVVESAASLNDVMLALSNIGGLNEETFADLQTQGLETFDRLTGAGFTEQQSLQQMQGWLEQVRTAHKDLGLPIDENTAKLIAQAEEQGILKEAQLSTNDIMLQGLSAIIEAVGGKLPEAWKTAQEAASDSAKTVAEDVDDTVNATLDEQQEKLEAQERAWQEDAREADRAALAMKKSMEKVDKSLDNVQTSLDDTDWDGWAADAVSAAQDVEGAVTGVAEGHSPGGIKEIPIRLAQAQSAFKIWERIGVKSAENLQDTIDSMRGRELGINGVRTAGIPTQMDDGSFVRQVTQDQGPLGGESVNLTFNITSMDPAGVELVTERKILPAMVKILRRGRNLADLQTVLDLKG